ncbi:Stp1/IreP family PP2C-type Ser/Thr phosphatase [Ruminiclostridium cellobioparum]|uniref:Serine/threonine protein phosphatase n=1 Tax=Ruminiclostridium cellobioparum subsp. termitidis CT1112 TaxID=1195236 RepID=S0FF85_RUMCE|nr:Stp1/IreP family PP2C-type Ser/Thr phosphatase [Ruminiclostridium cellobioparum]EMS69405.1 Serine/threonine protein phosphatase [Ruminiclostridium cellobioparum subsp. termitidis CT1112]
MKYGIRTDRGLKRQLNEDNCNVLVGYPGIPACFVIADGMGGHKCGEVASKQAVDSVCNLLLKADWEKKNISEMLRDIIVKVNDEIYNFSLLDEATQGMGTTLIITVLKNRKLYIGHVGDSRVYIIREDSIEKVTWDHSFIEELVKNGSITRDEAVNHPKRNLITRAVGYELGLQVDTYEIDLKDNDIILLCTDGLTNMLTEEEILDIIKNNEEPQDACDTLIQKANNNGGEDNTTVIVGKI